MAEEPSADMVRFYFVTEFAIRTHRTHHCVTLGLRMMDPNGSLSEFDN